MNKMNKSRWQVRAAVLSIFLLGAAAGALSLNAYNSWFRTSAQMSRTDRFAQLNERLQLNPEQSTKVRQIFADTREQLQSLRKESAPRVTEIRRQADEHLQQILTPAQWQQFQQMRDESQRAKQHGDKSETGKDY